MSETEKDKRPIPIPSLPEEKREECAQMIARYADPNVEGGQYQPNISRTALGKMGKKRQQDIMRRWFYERYEDPVNSQPYDSSEGGYIYVNGGPFGAREELEAEFSPIVKQTVIDELAKELEDECMDWTHTDSYDLELYPEEEDFYEINAALDNQTPLENLKQSLFLLRLLNKKDQNLLKFQLMMIYVFCITSLETYLSDVFTKSVRKYRTRHFTTSDGLRGYLKKFLMLILVTYLT